MSNLDTVIANAELIEKHDEDYYIENYSAGHVNAKIHVAMTTSAIKNRGSKLRWQISLLIYRA